MIISHTTPSNAAFWTVHVRKLITGLCILLRVYQLNIGITSVRNIVFFSARFYCALLTIHVSAPFGGHLQVVRKHKKYLRQSLYIQRIL
jgi:hypothetical protein